MLEDEKGGPARGQPLIKEGQRTQIWASVKQYWFVGKVRIKRDIGSFEGLTARTRLRNARCVATWLRVRKKLFLTELMTLEDFRKVTNTFGAQKILTVPLTTTFSFLFCSHNSFFPACKLDVGWWSSYLGFQYVHSSGEGGLLEGEISPVDLRLTLQFLGEVVAFQGAGLFVFELNLPSQAFLAF